MSGPLPLQNSSEWTHYPAYFCAHPEVRTKDYKPGEGLPFGVPIKFETDLFEGTIFLRVRSIDSYPDDQNHDVYFKGEKRFWHAIIQGRFKEEVCMSDILLGDFYEKPFSGMPMPSLVKVYQKFLSTFYPGMIMDVASDTPKVLVPIGSCQIMRIDHPGQEPIITGVCNNVKEDTSLLLFDEKISSIENRRKYLSKMKNSSKHKVNPSHVYTIEMYNDRMDFETYHLHVMGGLKMDMVSHMNGQAVTISCFTRDKRVIFKFPIWHERLLSEIRKKEKSSTENNDSIEV